MTEDFQIWNVNVKIPRCILRSHKERIRNIFERFKDELEELTYPLAVGYLKSNPPKCHVISRLVKS